MFSKKKKKKKAGAGPLPEKGQGAVDVKQRFNFKMHWSNFSMKHLSAEWYWNTETISLRWKKLCSCLLTITK